MVSLVRNQDACENKKIAKQISIALNANLTAGQACNNLSSIEDMHGTSTFGYQLTLAGLYELHIFTREGVGSARTNTAHTHHMRS